MIYLLSLFSALKDFIKLPKKKKKKRFHKTSYPQNSLMKIVNHYISLMRNISSKEEKLGDQNQSSSCGRETILVINFFL